MSVDPTAPWPVPRAPIRIGLWGPPGSGKTTYLAALKVAVTRLGGDHTWIMNGLDDDASDWLVQMTDILVQEQRFPEATRSSQAMTFQFNGEVAAPASPRWRSRRNQPDRIPVSFDLDVFDPPGNLYGYQASAPPAPEMPRFGEDVAGVRGDEVVDRQEQEERLLEHLEECQGIVFLFDPVRDKHHADAFKYFHMMMEKLARRWFARPQQGQVKLPQHLAVCVTKFDDHDIYRQARKHGLTETDPEPPFMPRVPDHYAERFFRQLCNGSRGNADLVMNSIDSYLDPQRVRYYVTSAIGLYVGPDRRFRPHDPVNIAINNDGTAGIRGRVYPMNLFEPLLWLEECIRNPR